MQLTIQLQTSQQGARMPSFTLIERTLTVSRPSAWRLESRARPLRMFLAAPMPGAITPSYVVFIHFSTHITGVQITGVIGSYLVEASQ